MEGTYGFIRNELAGGNENGVLVNESSNRLTSLPDFPLLYPDAGSVDSALLRESGAERRESAVVGRHARSTCRRSFALGQPHRRGAAEPALSRLAEHQPDAGRRDQLDEDRRPAHDQGRLLQQPQLQGAERRRRRWSAFQGDVDFGNDTNNPLDTQFGYANAATGIFRQYQQAEKFIEGSMIYNNTEFYIQDNWKVNNRLTMDYGIRFTRQQPQYDQFQQMSNFFPDQWSAGTRRCSTSPAAATAPPSARATSATRWIRAPARSCTARRRGEHADR